MKKLISKEEQIKRHLMDGKSITQQMAIKLYGHYRLAVVINRLRNKGFVIETIMQKNMFKEIYAEYKLISS